MDDIFSRSEILLGKDKINILKKSHVAVFGIGGVGSYAVEALVRSGVGKLDLIDGDRYSASNLNRQLYATLDTIGEYKGEVAKESIKSINPDCIVKVFNYFYSEETQTDFDLSCYDYIIDAIDSVNDKVRLIVNSKKSGAPIISSMGAANKLDGTKFKVADIYETSVCPLARIMRSRLKTEGIESLKTVYSFEQPVKPEDESLLGSVSFVPSVAGLIIAGEVIKDLIK